MAVTVPPFYTGIHDEEVRFLVSSQEESLRKVIQNVNYLGNIFPLGTIIFVQINQVGVSPVDVSMWQLCDGSEITDPKSRLRTIGLNVRFVPNIEDKFPRVAQAQTSNPSGGNRDFPAGHNHTIGGITNGGGVVGEEGDERKSQQPHSHDIQPSLSNVTIDYPAYIGYALYMKIK